MNREWKEKFVDATYAVVQVVLDQLPTLVGSLILGPLQHKIAVAAHANGDGKYVGSHRLASARALAVMSEDGAWLEGPVQLGYAKFAIRKGLPIGTLKKTMAVENDPHTVDDFDGVIKEGYGKGIKRLVWKGQATVKVKDQLFISKVNIHRHQADRAGDHYDFVAEGIHPGVKQFEINIPAGPFKGRFAFVRPESFGEGQVLITRMTDKSVINPKPTFINKTTELLAELDEQPNDVIVEWKPDGSMGNVVIRDNHAIFRSHREQAEPYYEKLPALEWLQNRSRLISNRLLFKGPDQNGTVLKGELFHPEGAARVGGILNSSSPKAIEYQQKHGPVEYIVWDIAKLRGRDVSKLPYGERRALYEDVVNDIQRFNGHYSSVPAVSGGGFVRWYAAITGDARGLPYSEGVVVKSLSDNAKQWYKVKFRDTMDVRVVDIVEGRGKYAGTTGTLVVETPGGGRGEVGLSISDWERQWIWDNWEVLKGQVAEITHQEITDAGAPRAGQFIRWHPSKSDVPLRMYTMDDNERLYATKSAVGWRRK